MYRRGLSHLSPPRNLGTGGTQLFQATWPFRPQVPFGLAGLNLFSPPGALGTAGLNRFSPQASSGRAVLIHFRPQGHFGPQARLGLARSVFSVAQVPWRLVRLSNSTLPGTFGTRGTRSFQPLMYAVDRREPPQFPWYFRHWRDSVVSSPMVLKAPRTVRTRGTRIVQPPRCPGNGRTQSFQPPDISVTGETLSFQAPGSY